jgi:regulator of extracellular matrix RemA (YlzA/DUF370 family)
MKSIQLVNVGFGNTVSAKRIIAVVSPESSPIKRMVAEAREGGKLIDATYGRKTRAVIVCDNGSVVLSSVQPDTIAHRITNRDSGAGDGDTIEDLDEGEDT